MPEPSRPLLPKLRDVPLSEQEAELIEARRHAQSTRLCWEMLRVQARESGAMSDKAHTLYLDARANLQALLDGA